MTQSFIFVLSSFAVWRASNLLSNERGPFGFFRHLRYRVYKLCLNIPFCRRFHLYELVTCEWCNSVWFAGALTAFYVVDGIVRLSFFFPYVFALSAVAILIKLIAELLTEAKNWFIAARKALEVKS